MLRKGRDMDQVIDSFRSSTIGWLKGTLAGWGTAILAVAGIVLAIAGVGGHDPATRALPLLATLAALIIIGWVWISNMAAAYTITDERLIVRRGILSKSIDEIELYRIKDIRLNFTIINQVAGIGTICIASSDETTRTGDLVIANVERASERREELRKLVDTARQKRRVRELDMHREA
jgi:uncharacterized membrane protein YdbT with pleckstrin-like domain